MQESEDDSDCTNPDCPVHGPTKDEDTIIALAKVISTYGILKGLTIGQFATCCAHAMLLQCDRLSTMGAIKSKNLLDDIRKAENFEIIISEDDMTIKTDDGIDYTVNITLKTTEGIPKGEKLQ